MPMWAATCNIKDILGGCSDEDPSELAGCARELADYLKNTLHGRSIPEDHDGFDELTGIIECFETEEFENFEQFNTLLGELYDWADEHRVWLG